MSDQTIQDVLYLIDAWERGAYADEYPTEIASLRQELAAARELKQKNNELVDALKSVHSICKSDLQYRQFPSSREYEIMNICEPLIAKHKEQE